MWSPQQIVLGLTESIRPSHVGRDLAGAIVGLRQAFPTTTTNAGSLLGLPALSRRHQAVLLAVQTIDRQRCNTNNTPGLSSSSTNGISVPAFCGASLQRCPGPLSN